MGGVKENYYNNLYLYSTLSIQIVKRCFTNHDKITVKKKKKSKD